MTRKAVGMRWRLESENRAMHQGREKSAVRSLCILYGDRRMFWLDSVVSEDDMV